MAFVRNVEDGWNTFFVMLLFEVGGFLWYNSLKYIFSYIIIKDMVSVVLFSVYIRIIHNVSVEEMFENSWVNFGIFKCSTFRVNKFNIGVMI